MKKRTIRKYCANRCKILCNLGSWVTSLLYNRGSLYERSCLLVSVVVSLEKIRRGSFWLTVFFWSNWSLIFLVHELYSEEQFTVAKRKTLKGN